MPAVSIMVKPVSGLCNMRCRYCFYADELSLRKDGIYEAMNLETLENLMRRAFIYADECVYLVFQGGEPTLAGAEFYRNVLRLEKKYNTRALPVQHAIQTNGLHIEDDLLEVLKEGRFLVGLSVDGTKALHDAQRVDAAGKGTYDRVIKTVDRLRQAGIETNILCVVGHSVAQQGREVFDALSRFGFVQFIPRLDPFEGAGDADSLSGADYGKFLIDVWERYAREIRKGHYVSVRAFDNWMGMLAGRPPESCGFAGCCAPNYLVESNGNVYPCDFYALDEWLLGNINDTTFKRMAASERMQLFCAQSAKPAPECLQCRYGAICRGGCRRDREPGIGLNRLCEGYRMFFDRCLKDMQSLQREIQTGKIRI